MAANRKNTPVSAALATSISGIPLDGSLKQRLGLVCPFVALDSAGEELDGFVDLLLQFAGHFADLGKREDAESVQFLLDKRPHAFDGLKVVLLFGAGGSKDVEINGLCTFFDALKFGLFLLFLAERFGFGGLWFSWLDGFDLGLDGFGSFGRGFGFLGGFLGSLVALLEARLANSASTASWWTPGSTRVREASNHRSWRVKPDMPSYSLVMKKEVKPHASMQRPQNMQRPRSMRPETIWSSAG